MANGNIDIDYGPDPVPPGPGTGYQTKTVKPVGKKKRPPPSGAQPGAFLVPLAPRAETMTTSSSTRFIEIDYNGNIIVPAVTNMNFTGAGVIVSNVGSAVTINIPGSNGTPTGPNNSLQYNNVGTLAGAANLTFNPSTSVLSVIGNVQASYFAGDATRLFNIQGANIVGEIPFAASSNNANTALTAVTAGTVTTAAQPAITSVGTLTSVTAVGNITTTGIISTTGNIIASGTLRGGNISTTGVILATGNIFSQGNLATTGIVFANGTITGGNFNTSGQVSAAGNVRGAFLIGDGSQITNLPAGDYNNANVTTLLASFGSNVISATGNITTTANVAGGNLKTTGLISATGDITGGNVNAGATIVATTHNGAIFSATGNVTGGNINTGGVVTAAGNVTGGNVRTVGQVSATGNITGNFFIGNGSLLTGISASGYGDSNVVTLLASYGSNTISTTGNITGGNIIGNIVGGGAGTPTITSTTNLDLSAVNAVRVIGGGTLRLPSLTTAQIANVIAANGDVIYNSNASVIQGYQANSWVRMTAGPAFMSYVTTGQSLSTTGSITSLDLVFDSVERETPAGLYNESTGIFQPTTAGYYQVNAGVAIGTTNPSPTYTNVFYSLVIYKNASGVVSGSVQSPVNVGGTYFLPESNASRLIYLNGTTDYVQCKLVYYVGTNVWTTTTNLVPNYFQATWVHD